MTEETKEQTKKQTKTKILLVRTTGAKRFCRAGVCFSDELTEIAEYTPEQLAAWQAEPELIVEFA